MLNRSILLFGLLALFSGISLGQREWSDECRDEFRKIRTSGELAALLDPGIWARAMGAGLIRTKTENKRIVFKCLSADLDQLSEDQKQRLTPANEHTEKYRMFLRSKRAGIAKLIRDPKCGSKFVFDATDKKCLNAVPISGYGAYYSFRTKFHRASAWSDIRYLDGQFEVGFKEGTLAMIANLGNVPLETVLQKRNPVVNRLRDFRKSKDRFEVNKKKQEIKSGLEIADTSFGNNSEAKINNTYLLRSINYWGPIDFLPDNGKRDQIVVFRVIAMTKNDVTILWRTLRKKTTRYLRK